MEDTMDIPTDMDTMDTIWERDLLTLNPPLLLNLKLMLKPNLGITLIMDIPLITATTMEDTTDILTTDTMLLERGQLKPNLKLLLPLRLRLNPGTDTMVDTTVILTDMDTTDIPTDMAVTGGRFLSLPKSPTIFSIPY